MKKVKSGKEGLIGLKGETKKNITTNKEGKVFVHGELWNAIADEDINIGEKVEVSEVDNMTLKVKKIS